MEEKIITAKTLDEAITKACVDLGVPSDELDYTVRQTGSNGFFGIGAKPYVISARIKSAFAGEVSEESQTEAVKTQAEPEIKKPEPVQEKPAPQKQEKKPESEEKRPEKREKPERGPKNDKKDKPKKAEKSGAVKENRPAKPEKMQEDKKPERRSEKPAEDPTPKAEAFLVSLFKSMDMQISCKAEFLPENNELDIELSGDDMGVLIGKRGQTLDALQYLTSQVINKHQSTYVRVKLDTENYRERRKETLETLAVNIAHKVRRNHRPVALEPMNPYERRIIHSILQNEKDVTTRSEGEEPYRHVIVCPVRRRKQGGRSNAKSEAAKAVAVNEAIPAEKEIRPEETKVTETMIQEALSDPAVKDIPKDLLPEAKE